MRHRLLMLTLAVLAWSVPAAPLCAQFGPKRPWLVLDTGGHTAPVSRALFTRDGKELITVSRDKTIRFWDVSDGSMLRVLRPPIGPAREGELYAAALSPDGKTLAVGGYGFHHPRQERRRPSPIYLIDLTTEEIARVLPGHNPQVQTLTFSRDGKYLASGGWDKLIHIWDVHDGKLVTTLKDHPGPITSLAFSPDGKRLLSADSSDSPEAWLWDVEKGQVVTKLAKHHKAPLTRVAWGVKNNELATGSDGENYVAIWNANGRHLKDLTYASGPMTCLSVAFAPDGKSVVVSGKDDAKSTVCRLDLAGGKPLYYVQDGNWLEDENGHVAVGVAAVSPDGKRVAVAGDRSHRVHVYDADKGDQLGEYGTDLLPATAVAFARDNSADSRTVVWRTRLLPKPRNPDKPRPDKPVPPVFFDRAFQFKLGDFHPVLVPPRGTEFHRNQWTFGDLQLSPEGGNLRLLNGKKPTDMLLEPHLGSIVPETVGFAGKDRAAFATTDGLVEVYDFSKGKAIPIGQLTGFNGGINSLAPSPDDGRYLVGSGEDNVLHIWEPRLAKREDAPSTHLHAGRVLSLFVGPPPGPRPRQRLAADWVAWTPEGYYAASPGGERLMGWHLNANGPDKLATFHPASRFRARFYRPDVIERLLTEGSVEKALAAAAKVSDPRVKDATVVEASAVLPPNVKVEISEPKAGKVEVTARASPEGKEPVTGLQLLIDERPWVGKPDKEGPAANKSYEAKWTVALPPGKHQIRVLARTQSSLGTSRDLVRETEPEKVKPKPALYVLAIGINGYQKVPKLSAAVRDATELEKTLKERSAPLFAKYEAKVITDENQKGVIDRKAMLAGFDWLKERQTPADVAVLYYAGHGDLRNKEFYLIPQDADPKDLAKTGLSRAELKERVKGLPGKVLVVLDACHSGAVGLLFDDISRELSDEDCGVVVICAASPRESAQEKIHGYLTLSVMDGLKGAAPVSPKDHCVYLHHLQGYVIDHVEELSNDKQHPTVVVPPWLRSFAVGAGKK